MEKQAQDAPRPSGPPGGPPGPPGGWLFTRMSKQQEILFNIMVAILQLIPQSTLTTVFPVSRDIAESFQISNVSVLPWLVAAYALSFGTFILIGGRLGDIFGYKTMVVIGFSWLSFWSVVAGLSHYAGYQLFFVARGFQGVGASLMVPNGLALLGRTYPPGSKQKIFSFTLFGLCAPVGAYLGMIFGALFTKFATWWWSFYTLAVVCCLFAIAATVILISPPPTPKQMLPVRERLRDMDWLGAITGVGGLICVQVSLVSAPASGWNTQYIFMLLIIGILLIAFFVVTELKIAQQPLVPFRMLKADVGFVLAAVACGWATFGIWTWFLWKFLLGIKGDAPLEAAVHVLPIVPVAFIASVLTAWMMRKCRPSWTLFWALVAFTFGPLLLAVDSNIDKTTYWSWTFASLICTPFGMDMSFPAATLIMSNYFPPQQQGVAGSLISTVVNYSISLGLGLASTVEVHVNNQGRDPLAGIRGGWFMGVGLGGLGVVICVAFVLKSILHPAPAMPQGPPGAPGPGSTMQMKAQPALSAEENLSRPDTVSSLATTMVPDTPKPQNDLEPFKSFHFDIKAVSSASPLTASPPHTMSSSPPVASDPITSKHSTHGAAPSLPPKSKARDSSRRNKQSSKPKAERNSRHIRSDSQVHLHASSPQTSISSHPTTFPYPREPDAVHHSSARSTGDSECEYDSEQPEQPRWDMLPPRQSNPNDDGGKHPTALSQRYNIFAPDSAPRMSADTDYHRDADGFEPDARPVLPRGMMGDRF